MSDTYYVCSECNADDRDHQTYTPAPAALICWSCRAGHKMSISDQIQAGYGMIPKTEPVN